MIDIRRSGTDWKNPKPKLTDWQKEKVYGVISREAQPMAQLSRKIALTGLILGVVLIEYMIGKF